MGLIDRLERLGKVRDGVLITGTLLYIAGYLSWSVVAWRMGYGAVPLLDAQYFIAGIIPTAVLASTALGVSLAYLLLHVKYARYVRSLPLGKLLLVHGVAVLLAALGILALLLVETEAVPNPWIYAAAFLLIFAAGALLDLPTLYERMVAWVVAQPRHGAMSEAERRRFERTLRWGAGLLSVGGPGSRWYLLLIPVAAGLFLTWKYVEEVYPSWPQALGGAAPRCARLDVSPQQFSRETLHFLGGGRMALTDSAAIATTPPLLVHRQSGEYLLVSPGVSEPGDPRMVQIRTSHVQAIAWCD